jgi:hypothetical protein
VRRARVCYDHLAGEMGVAMFDGLAKKGFIAARGDDVKITRKGEAFFPKMGIDLSVLSQSRRPLCKSCLDWSHRRSHLAGSLGAALLDRIYAEGWAMRDRKSRAVIFTRSGEARFRSMFGA